MRTFNFGMILVLGCLAFLSPINAQTSGTGRVTIKVKDIDAIALTNGGTMTLTGAAGSNILSGISDSTALLNYSHNSPTPKKITAKVINANNPAGHDITLKVTVQGGVGQITLVLDGTGQGALDAITNISTGKLTDRTITYDASCTASGTLVTVDTDFVFTVTFTTTN